MTLPVLSMWIIAGGRTQQSATGGVSSASSSISVISFGRSYTQTLSSLSTARPVTPPIFHLFGSGLGQSGSNLYRGAVCLCAIVRIGDQECEAGQQGEQRAALGIDFHHMASPS